MTSGRLTVAEWAAGAPFTLGLSAGFFGFFAHTGVAAALEERGLRPSSHAGASAGALVGAALACGMSATELHARLRAVRRADFWDPWPGRGVLRGDRFRALLREVLPVATFAECARPLSVSVWDVESRAVRTVRDGDLAAAVHASCCVPIMFHPVTLDGRTTLDGGIGDRAGLAGVADGTRVLHHHLSSRSPWRRRGDPALLPPRRAGLTALVVDGLPRLSPFRLEGGPVAFEVARDATRRALDQPVAEVVRVGVA